MIKTSEIFPGNVADQINQTSAECTNSSRALSFIIIISFNVSVF